MSEWISVSNEKPKEKGKYLCFSSYGVGCALFAPNFGGVFQDCATNNDEGMVDWDDVEYKVTHWMPLPDPPKKPEAEFNTKQEG